MYADNISYEDPVLATESVQIQPVLSWTEALGCRPCRTGSRASPRGRQDRGKSSPGLCGGTRKPWGESHGIFHLKGLWKGQQGLPKQVVLPFPRWTADHHVLKGEAYRRRQIHLRILYLCSFLLLHNLSCFQLCMCPALCSGPHSIISPLYLQISLIPAQHAKE